MTNNLTMEQQAELEQQAAEREAAEKQDANFRRLAKIQAEENERAAFERKMQNLGALSDGEFRELTAKWGF